MPQVCRLVFAMNERLKTTLLAINGRRLMRLFIGCTQGKLFYGGKDTLKPWCVVESTPVIQRGGRRFALLRVVVHSLCAR
ncbi:hypothetical protein DDM70_07165 [Vibrio cholerae]|nr:hypothetical protein [Vibrio cholerae]GHY55986.1 hypothetical protein VCSRO24_2532 [Vibrio cholerae]